MKFSRLLVTGALFSVLVHAAGSAYFATDPDEVQIAASEGGAVSVVGSLEDLVAGSDVPLEPIDEPLDEIDPLEDPVEIAAVPQHHTNTPPVPRGSRTDGMASYDT